jgi:predicted dinucleotide-binding enzyme
MTRVGVIGSGVAGQTLARGFKTHRYDVRIGSRTPGKLAEFSATTGIQSGGFSDVAAWADSIVLAVSGHAAIEAINEAGPQNISGKLVIDVTNPLTHEPPVNGVLKLFTGPNESLMEKLQAAVPSARFVKAFNSVGAPRMVNPSFSGGPATMFYCGNDAAAKADVRKVLEQFGWEPLDMGVAAAARAIEPLVVLWCIPGFLENTWTHAFKLLR